MSLLLLRDARLYAPAALGHVDLLIGGGRVLQVGTALPALPAGVAHAEHDLGGRRVIPGLIDGHVHLTGGGGEAGLASKVPPLQLTQLTRAGVTSAVGVLGTDDVTRTTAELVTAARGLAELGFGAWCHTGGYHLPPTTLTGSVRGDIALIDRIIGVGEVAISDHRSSQPTLDELLRVAADAHVGGLMTGKAGILHLHLGDGPRGLDLVRRALDTSELPPRVFQPTHVNRRRALFEEALALAARGCTIDISAFDIGPDEDAWSAADALERAWAAGVPAARLTVSSDGGGCLPRFDAEGRVAGYGVGTSATLPATIRSLLDRGHSLDRILPPFTSTPAALLRLAGKGQIAAGSDADLVVLDEGGGVHDVMLGGRWVVRAGRAVVTGPFEAEA
ncbi:MAG: beta-aspartyl-peptidase [Gemmatimonadales bacterium]|nr:beta-aspartyl-peptidase [Gemmatimonadales bacterium]